MLLLIGDYWLIHYCCGSSVIVIWPNKASVIIYSSFIKGNFFGWQNILTQYIKQRYSPVRVLYPCFVFRPVIFHLSVRFQKKEKEGNTSK